MNKSSLTRPLVAALAISFCQASASQELTVRVVVKLREKVTDKAGKPFADVGGFLFSRNNHPYTPAKCPDVSNGSGEFVCKVPCDAKDNSMRLHLVSPAHEQARIVAGLIPPNAEPIDISNCKVTTRQPIILVYRDFETFLADGKLSNPDVYNAFVTQNVQGKPAFKAFPDAAAALQNVAKDSRSRAAMLEFSNAAALVSEASSERRPAWIDNTELKSYKFGINSVVLKALVKEASGENMSAKVKISDNSADFQRSVAAVEHALDTKPFLSTPEINLSNDVRQMRERPAVVHLPNQRDRTYSPLQSGQY